MPEYDVGEVVTITAAFTNTAGTAIDPTDVAVTVLLPDEESGAAQQGTTIETQVAKDRIRACVATRCPHPFS